MLNRLRLLLLLSCVLFGLGLFSPSITIVPQFGELTKLVKVFKPGFGTAKELSVAQGIYTLFREKEWTVGAVIFLFSVMFPLWKLGVLWGSIDQLAKGIAPSRELRFIEKLGKFSMLDVFVMAVLVVCIKGLPGGSQVKLEWGLVAFAASVLLSMRLAVRIEDESRKKRGGESGSSSERAAG